MLFAIISVLIITVSVILRVGIETVTEIKIRIRRIIRFIFSATLTFIRIVPIM